MTTAHGAVSLGAGAPTGGGAAAPGDAGPAGPLARVRARLGPAAAAPALPAVLTVLLMCVPMYRGDPAVPAQVTLADAASGALVAVCVARLLRSRRRPLTAVAAAVFAAPTVAIAVAACVADDPAAALPGFVRHIQIFVLVPVAVLLMLRSRRDFRLVAGAVVVVALMQGAVGVHQYVTGTGASYAGRDIRAVGTFGPLDIMGMATVVSYGLVVSLGVALAPPGGSRRVARGTRAAALSCAAFLAVPLAMSFSRGSWIATAGAAAVMLLLTGARVALRALVAAVAAAVVLLGGLGVGSQVIGERLTSITEVATAPDRSVTDRYALWEAAVGMWREEPAAGVGLKGFPAHRDSHASLGLSAGSDTAGAGLAYRREPLLSPHNMYLLLLSEQGLLGLLALGGGWCALLLLALRRRPAGPGVRGGADCRLVAVGLLVWQLIDFGYADIGGPSTVLTAVVLGLTAWWALAPAADRPPDGTAAPR
ncbi:O-antigen ligase family protein [Streptomyces sp. URMC 123]|uniref:O-antigen ligase family protein n=1 Tax=Streptomyces sp. URMC 123 TaxID=3423403 RepID=UPI003F1E1535